MGCGSSPEMPDYGQQAREAVLANLATYPTTYQTNAEAQLGIGPFKGLGVADNAKVMSDQMAQALLDIQKNYGPAFVKERLAELKEADPKGYAARKQLFDQILAQADAQPNRPMAQDLQDQINSQLQSAGKLTPRELQEVQQQVRGGQVAKGNYLGNAATEQEGAAAVNAAGQKLTNEQQQAMSYLEQGISPEDVAYRRLEQSLGNLSSFINGTTPTAQFRSLSNAGNGAAPFTTGPAQTMVYTNPNAGQQGAQNALQIYQGQVNWAQQQVNPYVAGISTAAGALGTAANLGYRPWGTPTNPGTYTPAFNASAPQVDSAADVSAYA